MLDSDKIYGIKANLNENSESIDDKELKEIQKSLNITPSPIGIYMSKRALPTLEEILISKHQRLVLLKSFQDGFIVLQ